MSIRTILDQLFPPLPSFDRNGSTIPPVFGQKERRVKSIHEGSLFNPVGYNSGVIASAKALEQTSDGAYCAVVSNHSDKPNVSPNLTDADLEAIRTGPHGEYITHQRYTAALKNLKFIFASHPDDLKGAIRAVSDSMGESYVRKVWAAFRAVRGVVE